MAPEQIAITQAIIAFIALLLNLIVFKNQKKTTRVTLLNEFSSRYFDIIDKQNEYSEGEKIGQFNVMFLNHLEWLAYLVNRRYLPLDMAEIYQGVIINWYEKVRIGQREVLSDYFENQPHEFKDLDILYKKLKKKKFK